MVLISSYHGPYLLDLLRSNRYSIKDMAKKIKRSKGYVSNRICILERRGIVKVKRVRSPYSYGYLQNVYTILL